MSSCCRSAVLAKFDESCVEEEVDRYEQKGIGMTAGRLVEGLSSLGVDGATLLDIGAGLGEIQAALFPIGLASAVHVEISPAYGAAGRDLARARGFEDRVEFRTGDYVEIATRLEDADIVSLDRVVCCYDDMPALLDASIEKARRVYALSAPRTNWLVRVVIALENGWRRLRRRAFRTYVHSWREMDRRIRRSGFRLADSRGSFVWRIHIYERSGEGMRDG